MQDVTFACNYVLLLKKRLTVTTQVCQYNNQKAEESKFPYPPTRDFSDKNLRGCKISN